MISWVHLQSAWSELPSLRIEVSDLFRPRFVMQPLLFGHIAVGQTLPAFPMLLSTAVRDVTPPPSSRESRQTSWEGGLKVDAPLSWTPLSPSPLPRMTPVSTKTEVMLQRLYKSKSLVQWHDLQFLLSNDTLKVKDIHNSEIVLSSHSSEHPRRAQTPPSRLRPIRQEAEEKAGTSPSIAFGNRSGLLPLQAGILIVGRVWANSIFHWNHSPFFENRGGRET